MRKVFLINKPFQLSIIGWFMLLSVLLVLTFYSTIWYFFYNFNKEAVLQGLPPNHVFFAFLNEQQMAMNHIFIISSFAATLIIVIGGILISHKVAGPIHQLTMHLKNHTKETATRLQFRKSDYFKETQDAFNEFIEK